MTLVVVSSSLSHGFTMKSHLNMTWRSCTSRELVRMKLVAVSTSFIHGFTRKYHLNSAWRSWNSIELVQIIWAVVSTSLSRGFKVKSLLNTTWRSWNSIELVQMMRAMISTSFSHGFTVKSHLNTVCWSWNWIQLVKLTRAVVSSSFSHGFSLKFCWVQLTSGCIQMRFQGELHHLDHVYRVSRPAGLIQMRLFYQAPRPSDRIQTHGSNDTTIHVIWTNSIEFHHLQILFRWDFLVNPWFKLADAIAHIIWTILPSSTTSWHHHQLHPNQFSRPAGRETR